jgi:ABC-type antimicrobial peptide transport system permease subunit
MKIKHIIQTGGKSLKSNKGRSLLTILGIVIGITAIMLIFSLGSGAQKLITSQLESLGSKVLFVGSGRGGFGPPSIRANEGFSTREIEFINSKSNVPYAKSIIPMSFTGGIKMTFADKTKSATVQGGSAEMERVFAFTPEIGTFFTEEDVLARSQVVVLGAKLAEELFQNGEDPLGKRVKIKDTSFTVIGVLPLKGQTAIFGIDNNAVMPVTSLQQYIAGNDKIQTIVVEAQDEKYTAQTEKDVKSALYFLRGFDDSTDPEKIDFNIQNQQSLVQTVSTILGGFSLFLTSVAAISLIVGGIGIMNIMLVSVTERTREIGLRKALGARNSDVLWQFLFEAALLTGLGGLVGSLLGASLSYLASIAINKFTDLFWTFEFPWAGMVIGIVTSLIVGLVFGIYPARQASKKSPTEALRYE